MLIQTKPKEAGPALEAVQFLGDPSVHPDIYWCPEENIGRGCKNRAHWRVSTTEERGSSYLEIGDWIVGCGRGLRLIHEKEFELDWRVAAVGEAMAAKEGGAT